MIVRKYVSYRIVFAVRSREYTSTNDCRAGGAAGAALDKAKGALRAPRFIARLSSKPLVLGMYQATCLL